MTRKIYSTFLHLRTKLYSIIAYASQSSVQEIMGQAVHFINC